MKRKSAMRCKECCRPFTIMEAIPVLAKEGPVDAQLVVEAMGCTKQAAQNALSLSSLAGAVVRSERSKYVAARRMP
jgi:hypothetical protein